MAVDTAEKRNSAMLHGLMFRIPPIPSGSVSLADRHHLVFLYTGISASSEPPPDSPQDIVNFLLDSTATNSHTLDSTATASFILEHTAIKSFDLRV